MALYEEQRPAEKMQKKEKKRLWIRKSSLRSTVKKAKVEKRVRFNYYIQVAEAPDYDRSVDIPSIIMTEPKENTTVRFKDCVQVAQAPDYDSSVDTPSTRITESKAKQRVRFNHCIQVTQAPDYDRSVDIPWRKMTLDEKIAIKMELNEFKRSEMSVHEDSRHLTKFDKFVTNSRPIMKRKTLLDGLSFSVPSHNSLL